MELPGEEAGCGGCVKVPGNVALDVVEALAAGAEALCEPATCCDCDGAEAVYGVLDLAACVYAFPRGAFPCGAFTCACEPATCCDCNGAEAGFREMRVCVLYVPLISVLPMHYQAAVVAVQKQPMDRKHPKTLSRMQEHMAQQHADRAYEAPVQSTAAGAFQALRAQVFPPSYVP